MTSISTQYWRAMLAQAVCIGLASGRMFVPSFAILPQYFTKRKGFATGIAASGSSVGKKYEDLATRLVSSYIFRWHQLSRLPP